VSVITRETMPSTPAPAIGIGPRSPRARGRARTLAIGVVLAAWLALAAVVASPPDVASADEGSCTAPSLYVVAHQDDTILFQSPDLLKDIQGGRCVRTVFLTAGDDGQAQSYWTGRELGAQAAYATMAGVADDWTTSTLTVDGHAITMRTLNGRPGISLVYLRLPDGGYPAGDGTSAYGNASLKQLWQHGNGGGGISSIGAIDGSATYDYAGLLATLTSIITQFAPRVIATQDDTMGFDNGGQDHADHLATGYFTRAAQAAYPAAHRFVSYVDYPTQFLDPNVSGTLLAQKQAAYYAYAAHDSETCATAAACESTTYGAWLSRQYEAASATVGVVADAGYRQSADAGSTVRLDGTASSAQSGGALSYAWTQTGGPAVSLSGAATASPSFVAPSGAAASTLTFSLAVSDGSVSSEAASVTVNVAAAVSGGSAAVNVAGSASVSASSEKTADGQTAAKAVDGLIGGYPGVATQEWATSGQTTGAWLLLSWGAAQTLDHVTIYDRPNTDDDITSGTLTFSDGSSVAFGALPDDGASGLTVTFSARATTSLKLTVTGVSATTQNVGLSELQAYAAPSTGGGSTGSPPGDSAGGGSSGGGASSGGSSGGTPATSGGTAPVASSPAPAAADSSAPAAAAVPAAPAAPAATAGPAPVATPVTPSPTVRRVTARVGRTQTTLLLSVSARTAVKVVVQRASRGSCPGATATRCTVWRTIGTLTRRVPAGATALEISRALGARVTRDGRYRANVTATGNGAVASSAAKSVEFRIG
jgi:LmbE family N-acetylglucosaminyl deacetylase